MEFVWEVTVKTFKYENFCRIVFWSFFVSSVQPFFICLV